ncbi:hypothetical protein F503_07546 [Ophiostoma piceae UAMH 11346]|uniref:Uncharacterized protein n=1 Tax=Ophiostoma piceae (strain UAMH 11346) TaxID=1262450 RepID=S3D8J9_OPHP1|nr:hypothetical protein F503_07546 [Ophiostoma piceae UAMH 11346]
MHSLDKLPLELIYEVCALLCEPQKDLPDHSFDKATLVTEREPALYVRKAKEDVNIEATQHAPAALSRTCRRLCAIVQLMLYVCPAITATNCGTNNDAAVQRLRQRFESLVVALERRPGLAAAMTGVSLCSVTADHSGLLGRLFVAAPNLATVRVCLSRPLADAHVDASPPPASFRTLQLDSHDSHYPTLSLAPGLATGPTADDSGGWLSAVQTLHLRQSSHVRWTSGSPPLPQPFRAVGPGLATVSIRLPHLSYDEEDALLATDARQLQTSSLRDALQTLRLPRVFNDIREALA